MSAGWGIRWGNDRLGWGSAFEAPISAVSPSTIPDDGAVTVQLSGSFSAGRPHRVWLGGVPCYSGVSGQGLDCYPASDGTLSFIAPGGLPLGPQGLVVTWPAGGYQELAAAFTVVRRVHRLKCYEIARLFPGRVYKGRGYPDIRDRQVLDP